MLEEGVAGLCRGPRGVWPADQPWAPKAMVLTGKERRQEGPGSQHRTWRTHIPDDLAMATDEHRVLGCVHRQVIE